MSLQDKQEYGTGQNTNPADIPANVPGRPPANWETGYLNSREKQLEDAPWFPRATGQPGPPQSKRFKAFTGPDESAFQASVSPQAWDTTALAIPQYGGVLAPQQVLPGMPGRAHAEIVNTGNNPVVISPTVDKALNGIGRTIAVGASFSLDSQAPAWAMATGGTSNVEVTWTYWEAPSSHLPPKENEA